MPGPSGSLLRKITQPLVEQHGPVLPKAAAAVDAQTLRNIISRGELIGMTVLLVTSKGGKVTVGLQF
jgi:hypothetical protein